MIPLSHNYEKLIVYPSGPLCSDAPVRYCTNVQLALFALQLHSQDIKISCIYHSRGLLGVGCPLRNLYWYQEGYNCKVSTHCCVTKNASPLYG